MASPKAPPDLEEDPMFVIKNLDTGLEMRIDDFDRIANIATDEIREQEPEQKKKGVKGAKDKVAKWTAGVSKKASAIAKKAASEIKEAAHELNVQHVLIKQKAAAGSLPEPSPSKAGPSGHGLPSPLSELLLRRSSTNESSSAPGTEPAQAAASGPTPVCTTEQSLSTSSHASRQPTSASSIGGSTAATPTPAAGLNVAPASGAAPAAGSSLVAPLLSAPLTAGLLALPVDSGGSAVAAAAPAAGVVAQAGAAAAAAQLPPGPVVPAAVRLVSHKRAAQQVQDVVLAQVLEGCCGVVWAVAFSRDGSFLATAGQDGILRVWQLTASRDKELRSNWVYATPVETTGSTSSAADGSSSIIEHDPASPSSSQPHQQQQQQQQQENCHEISGAAVVDNPQLQGSVQRADSPVSPKAQHHHQQPLHLDKQKLDQQPGLPPVVEFGPYFSQQPVRQYTGHSEDILDISWSAGGFILTASVDKSVRLWHISQPDCLRQFWHSDFVTSVQFHPLDAQRFVSGCIDGKIRVWSITDKAVLAMAQVHEAVTAVGFSLNGNRVLAGTMRGRVRFYELADRKLEYVAQVDVRNQRGAYASGKKVTGICAVPGQPQQFLITTNDSRLRLLEGLSIALKFKGHRNMSTQLRANLSLDGRQVVCGSDDGWVYVWRLGKSCSLGDSKNALHQAFHAHDTGVPVTAVAFAPPGACDGKPSVLLNYSSGGAAAEGSTAAEGAAAAEGIALRPGFAGRTVQSIIVSGSFNGSVRVHELL